MLMIDSYNDFSAPLLALQELLRDQYCKLIHNDIDGAAEMGPQVLTEVKLLQNSILLMQAAVRETQR